MKLFTKTQQGFSLIELMVVVAIIGILSAIAVPNFQRFQRKARQSEAKSTLGSIHTALKAFENEWEVPTGNLLEAGYTPEGVMKYAVGLEDSPFSAPGDYPATRVAAFELDTFSDTFQICSNTAPTAAPGNADERCGIVDGPVWPAARPAGRTTITAPAAVGASYSYALGAEGDIGGAVSDQWTMTQSKVLDNPQDGTE